MRFGVPEGGRGGGWSLASVRRVSRCGWSKADALATKVGAFTCLKSLLYARYVCAAPAPAPAATTTTTTWNTLLIMLMLLDEFRVTKQEEAQNLHGMQFFFFFSSKNNRKSTKGKRKRECAIKTENEAAAREDDEDDEMRLCVIAWQSRCCSGGRFSCNNPKVTWLLEQLLRWNFLQLQELYLSYSIYFYLLIVYINKLR